MSGTDPLRTPSSGIQIATARAGTGVCAVCGNGLWPGQPLCEHREDWMAAERRRNDERDRHLREIADPDCTLCRGKGQTSGYVGPSKTAYYPCRCTVALPTPEAER